MADISAQFTSQKLSSAVENIATFQTRVQTRMLDVTSSLISEVHTLFSYCTRQDSKSRQSSMTLLPPVLIDLIRIQVESAVVAEYVKVNEIMKSWYSYMKQEPEDKSVYIDGLKKLLLWKKPRGMLSLSFINNKYFCNIVDIYFNIYLLP